MNILDIAIAKKLAGGGGGSGTDNYNDLSNLPKINDTTLSGNKTSANLGLQSEINSDSKLASDLVDDTNQDNKFVTSSEKSTWNGKQNAIDADHKINADYVDDSTSTNKFVTATDKETWNAKQNAIDSSHKLSSDLVDDTNHTNKFVTSTEKQTWNGKQNAIDSDHKLSSSLVSFTTAEAAALASGIDSTKVGQISTNQTNILYATNKVGKNELKLTGDVSNPNTVRVYWNYEEGTVRITGTLATTSTVFISLGSWTAKKTGEYVLASEGANSTNIYVYDDGSWNTNGSPIATWTAGTTRNLYVRIASGVVVGDVTVKPMVCLKTLYDEDSSVDAYALPNYDLTCLQAEDRAALAEEIDAGAKNKCNWAAATVSFNQACSYTKTDTNLTVTSTTADGWGHVVYSLGTFPKGDYVLSVKISSYSATYDTCAVGVSPTASSLVTIPGNGTVTKEFTLSSAGELKLYFYANYSGTAIVNSYVASEIMVCTKAAFGVSQKFVPYRPNWDLVAMSVWNYSEKSFTSTAVNTYEYSGVSFTVPANQIYEFIVMDRKENARTVGILVADNNSSVESAQEKSIVAENTQTYSGQPSGLWGRQVTGMTAKYNQNNTFYVWVKRDSAAASTIQLAYRRIY